MVNKITKFFEKGPGKYNRSAYDTLNRKIANGESLRNLCRFLEGAGLKVSPSTVSKYIGTLEIEYKEQRKVEKIGKKIKQFFKKNEMSIKTQCKHINTTCFLDHDGMISVKCYHCQKIIGRHDPSKQSKRWQYKHQIILEALK